MIKGKRNINIGLMLLILLVSATLRGDEPQLILDDDWKLWFRIGPTLGLPVGDSAIANDKLTFAYGGLVGGTLGKMPGNWAFEFVKTESSLAQYPDISSFQRANVSSDDIQFLLSWQLPLSKRTGIAPYVELILGGILASSNIEAQVVEDMQLYSLGFDNAQRFTYLAGAGAGASLLIGTVAGGADSRPVGVALQAYGRWLYGGPVPMALSVLGDYPLMVYRHYQCVLLGFGLQFLL